MIHLSETTDDDLEQITEWLNADSWHKDDPLNKPELMITGNGLLAFCLSDDEGPLAYVKLTEEGDLNRISIQFAPENVVSKRRLAVGLVEAGIPAMKIFAQENGYKGLVFESINPSLIAFGRKQGFESIGNNDFAMIFEKTHMCTSERG